MNKSTKHGLARANPLSSAAVWRTDLLAKRVGTALAGAVLVMAVTAGLVRGQSAGTVVITPVEATLVTTLHVPVNLSPGDQIDPHVSGDLASYTDGTDPQNIRYYRFSSAVNQAIPSPMGASDHLSDVSGDKVSFTRNTSICNAIMVFDVTTSSTTEVPPACSNRVAPAIGGNTVAYVDLATSASAVFAHDLSSLGFGTVQLSSGLERAQNPSVAPSGHVVVWEQCASSIVTCDIMKSTHSGGVWSAAAAVANTASAESNPDTDGTTVVYDADRAGNLTGQDIYWQPVVTGTETQLAIPGFQLKPSISQGVIGFESRATMFAPADIFVYVMATNTLYQITSTSTVDEQLNDVSVLDNGDIRVVWAANDGLARDYNIYATTFTPAGVVHYAICLLYDPTVARRSGTVYPIKAQLCDASGNNLSSPEIVVHAVSVTQTSTNTPANLDDVGNANPDFDFRYDAALGGYIFNLSLRGIATGTYNLNFQAGADPALHSSPFAVK